MTTPPVDHPSRRRRTLPVIAGAAVLLIVVGLGTLVSLRGSQLLEVDADWMEEIVEHRNPFWEVPALVFNAIGGGWIAVFLVPLGGAAAFFIARRPWSALYWLAAITASALLVQLLKGIFGRARPEDILVLADPGSFPSGHTANAATIAVVLGLILRRRWVWIVGAIYTIAMALSRTYLGAHWVTDTIGGALLGASIAVLIWTVFAPLLRRERLSHRAATEGAAPAEPAL